MLTARKLTHIGGFILLAMAVVVADPPAYGSSIVSANNTLPSVSGYVSASNLIGTAPGSITCDQCVIVPYTGLPADIFATTSASYGGSFNSSVTGNGSANGGDGTAGSALLIYDFEVVGSQAGVFTVPVIVTYSLLTDETAATSSAAGARAFFAVGGIGTTACSFTYVVAGSGCGIGSQVLLGESTTYNATPGSSVPIDIRIDGSAFNGTWAATVDPSVEIDPSFQYAADFTLEVSPGAQSTPEPSSSLLLGAGLLAIAGFLRRKVRKRFR
ncbi:MAG: PEP-CTERM sorting domain-containing protein [Candidatus Sulfopaludibacter sp.]|nr:PEP-CTERM sorting domain-containing protein [Candidatus Sulfopaludibacter sp.]